MKEDDLKIDILKGLNLKEVYDNIIRQLIPLESKIQDDIEELIELNERIESLKKGIKRLEKRIIKEKQFNRKVDLNIKLQKKKRELEELLEN